MLTNNDTDPFAWWVLTMQSRCITWKDNYPMTVFFSQKGLIVSRITKLFVHAILSNGCCQSKFEPPSIFQSIYAPAEVILGEGIFGDSYPEKKYSRSESLQNMIRGTLQMIAAYSKVFFVAILHS